MYLTQESKYICLDCLDNLKKKGLRILRPPFPLFYVNDRCRICKIKHLGLFNIKDIFGVNIDDWK